MSTPSVIEHLLQEIVLGGERLEDSSQIHGHKGPQALARADVTAAIGLHGLPDELRGGAVEPPGMFLKVPIDRL